MKNKKLSYIITALVTVIAFLCGYFNIFGVADKSFEDILYHNPDSIDNNIKIIKIDDKTMNALGDFSDWDRSVYAELMEILCVSEDVRPAVIGFDILFAADNGDESDKRFAELCAENGNVVTGFSYVFKKELYSDDEGNLIENAMAIDERVMPYPALAEATSQGFVNTLIDERDGVIRSTFVYLNENGTRTDSFVSAIYEKYMAFLGKEAVYPTDKGAFPFRYSSGVSEYENISLIDVLDGTIPPQAFDDCVVLVGAYAAGMMDAYYVPVDKGQQMYGVEIHANALQALMDGKTLTAVPDWANGLIAAVIALILMLVCEKLSVAKVVIVCIAAIAAKLGAGYLLFGAGYSWDNLSAVLMAVLIGIYFVALHYYRARAAKQSIEKAFSKYVAPQVVKEIAKNGTYELKLGGENRDIACLFVDIRGFTPLSESLEPEQVVDILNSYLELTTNCIFRHGGTLDKFIGDATMAVFNAPFDTDDYVYKAVLAAWDIVQGGNKIEEQFVERYGKHVGFGVGVNCGPAVVGNIGCDFRMDYTAIGDTVNTAARLEANAPRSTVYISGAVYEQVKDRITVEEVGEIPLKGKSKGVFVYSITGINDYDPDSEV